MTAIGLAVLGALIAGRPGNPIGWLMSVGALFRGVFSFTQQYAPWPSPSPCPVSTWRAGWPPGPTCRASPSPSPSSSSCSPTAVLAALVVRFRRSAGTERQQIKWFAYGAMIGIPLGLPAEVPFWGPILELVQPPLMFTGLGIGMFRYRP